MIDHLERLAEQAVRAPAIVPRIPARFEPGEGANLATGAAALHDVESWVEAPPPQRTQQRTAAARESRAEAAAPAVQAVVSTTATAERPAESRAPGPIDERSPTIVAVTALDAESMPLHVERLAAPAAARPADVEPGDEPPAAMPSVPALTHEDEPMPVVAHTLRLDVARYVAMPEPRVSTPPAMRDTPAAAVAVSTGAPVSSSAPPQRVEINIERIEVRAIAPAAPSARPPVAAAPAPTSLDEHLRRRRGEPA